MNCAATEPATLDEIIAIIEATRADDWAIDVVRDRRGRNCFFGHLFAAYPDEAKANRVWDWFESRWATTYMIFPVNDGENPAYQQATPRERILAYLRDLAAGRAKSTQQIMAEDEALWLASDEGAAPAAGQAAA